MSKKLKAFISDIRGDEWLAIMQCFVLAMIIGMLSVGIYLIYLTFSYVINIIG